MIKKLSVFVFLAALLFSCRTPAEKANSLINKFDSEIDNYLVYYNSALDNISQAIALLDSPFVTDNDQLLADLKSKQADLEISIGQQIKNDILVNLLAEGKKISLDEKLIEQAFSEYVQKKNEASKIALN